MRRTLFLLAVFASCLVLLTTIQNNLSAFDFILVESDAKPIMQNSFSLHEYARRNNYITDLSIYSTSPGRMQYNNNVMDVTLFGVEPGYLRFGNVKIISGRFISSNDIKNNSKVVVIEKNHAIQMFASKDCVGKKVSIDNAEYRIVGVYAKNNTLLDFLSSTHKNIVYNPLKTKTAEDSSKKNQAHILVRPKKGSSDILANIIATDLGALLKADIVINNLDVSSRNISQKINLSKFFIFILFAFHSLKIILANLRNYFEKIKFQLQNIYLREFILRNLKEVILHILLVGASIISIYFLYNSLKFDFYIAPTLLPKRLTDFNEIKENILNYCLILNTTPRIISDFSAYVSHAGNYTNILIVIFIACYFGIVKEQNALINNAFLALKMLVSKDLDQE